MSLPQNEACEGRSCFGAASKGEVRRHDNNNRLTHLCDTCAPELEHAGADNCWCTEWHVRWGDADNTPGGYSFRMNASHATDFAETTIWFSIRAWQVFCNEGREIVRESDPVMLKRIMASWGLEQVIRYIERYAAGDSRGPFALPDEFKLVTDQSSGVFRLDGIKAQEYLRRWKLV